jgi:3-methyladenine DNA glycosylase AlkD
MFRLLLGRLPSAFAACVDPARAASAAAYMRHQFPFLGISAPRLATIARAVTSNLPPPTDDSELTAVSLAWTAITSVRALS